VRRVRTEFVGTGDSVLAHVCGDVWLGCTHMCFVWGVPGLFTRVCLPACGAFGYYLVTAIVLLRHVAGPWILLRRCTARCRPHSHVMGEGSALSHGVVLVRLCHSHVGPFDGCLHVP
jgi:hypothetical protein